MIDEIEAVVDFFDLLGSSDPGKKKDKKKQK